MLAAHAHGDTLLRPGHRLQILLLLFNLACCGALVGLSRLLPRLAVQTFHEQSQSSILYFVSIFGISKAVLNLVSSQASVSVSRHSLLIAGWVLSCVSPLLILAATQWTHVLLATLFLGASQGILTSLSVIMIIDHCFTQTRGKANGILECTIYVSLAIFTFVSATINNEWGYRPLVPYVSLVVNVCGMTAAVFVHDTSLMVQDEHHRQQSLTAIHRRESVRAERHRQLFTTVDANGIAHSPEATPLMTPMIDADNELEFSLEGSKSVPPPASLPVISHTQSTPSMLLIFRRTFGIAHPRALVIAGFMNNLKDGLSWGLFPSYFTALGIDNHLVPYLLMVYPLLWGLLQPLTGTLSDRLSRKQLIVQGLALQSVALAVIAVTAKTSLQYHHTHITVDHGAFWLYLTGSLLLGVGTALCYPVLQASLSDSVIPSHRAPSLGVYRLCRDFGYVIGGLSSGVVGDYYDLNSAVESVSMALMVTAVYAQLCLQKETKSSSALH